MNSEVWLSNPWEEPSLEHRDARVSEPTGPTVRWHNCEIALHRGDISEFEADAVVCAANLWLRAGGGISGATFRRAGQALVDECDRMTRSTGKLMVSEAVITGGGALPARHVIHTVGPVYHDDPEHAPERLASAYRNCLRLAREHGLRSIAFPCISTGSYGFPKAHACQIVLETVREELKQKGFDRIVFCVTDPQAEEPYATALMTESVE
jgi:O-acetyl-ADP-ribose deacetylase (regulator of RNase III)